MNEMNEMKKNALQAHIDGSKAVLCPVRCSFVHLAEPYKPDANVDGKYTVTVMVPKTETAVLEQLKAAYNNAYQLGLQKKWNGAKPSTPAPFKNGDDKAEKYPELAGHVLLTAKTSNKIVVYGIDKMPILDQDKIYSGMWAAVKIGFYPYATSGAKGVAVSLDAVMKVDDDENFGGGSEGASAFDGLGLKPQAPAADDPMAGLI